MADIDQILRINPRAAAGVEGARDAVATIRKMREAGIATGPNYQPPDGGRKSMEQLKALQLQACHRFKTV